MTDSKDESLLFVRNIPYTLESQGLEDLFADIGPVKRAFVIKTGAGGESRGFGYVQFALREDAMTAIEKFNNYPMEGRKISVTIAEKKSARKAAAMEGSERKKPLLLDDDEAPLPAVAKQKIGRLAPRAPAPEDKKAKERKEAQAKKARTLILFNLSNTVSLDKLKAKASELGCTEVQYPVNRNTFTTVLKDDEDKPVASFVFPDKQSIMIAIQKLDKKQFLGSNLLLVRRESTIAESKPTKDQCRLIVRNMSWKVTSDTLRQNFSQYGPIAHVHIPEKEDGKSRGFGFVQYLCQTDAASAIASMNGKDVLGRVIAVDWVMAKTIAPKADVKGEGSEDGEDSDGGESGAEEKGEDSDSGESGAESASEDESDSEDELSETEDPEDSRPNDVNAGCTIFIRNLGYRTDQKALFEAFRKYGHIEFVKVVIDKETGMSRGTAFLKFKSSESANAAVAAGSVSESGKKHDKKFSGTSDGIIVDDRLLSVALAVDRSEAGRLLEDNKKRKEDKRHLYLANEGRITEDSDLGKSMPKADLDKRIRATQEKKTKLANPLFFISPVRVSIRNINKMIDDKKLKQACMQAAIEGMKAGLVRENEGDLSLRPKTKSPAIIINQALIVTDKDVSGKSSVSKGFGFVEFTEHIHALAMLRYMNNNPQYSYMCPKGDGVPPASLTSVDVSNAKNKSRPICEFSTENHMALKKQERRRELLAAKKGREPVDEEAEKDKKRKRREERIAKRERRDAKKANGEEAVETKDGKEVDVEESPKKKARRDDLVAKETRGSSTIPKEKVKTGGAHASRGAVPVSKREAVSDGFPEKEQPKQKGTKRERAIAAEEREAKRSKANDKEEKKLTNLEQSHTSKVFGDSFVADAVKKSRWFE